MFSRSKQIFLFIERVFETWYWADDFPWDQITRRALVAQSLKRKFADSGTIGNIKERLNDNLNINNYKIPSSKLFFLIQVKSSKYKDQKF